MKSAQIVRFSGRASRDSEHSFSLTFSNPSATSNMSLNQRQLYGILQQDEFFRPASIRLPPSTLRQSSPSSYLLVRNPPSQFDQSKPLILYFTRALPMIAFFFWLTTLLGLLELWIFVDKREQYRWYLGGLPFVSDVLASHKVIGIIGCAGTGFFFFASMLAERYLRSTRVLGRSSERLLF